jgi:hypothetical protein
MPPKLPNPVVLELAPLPREQVGPFLLLGLEKTATKEEIEANWAQRVIWARKERIAVPLEDVNWARETINDPDRRVRADVVSLNLDTTEGTLRRLVERFEVSDLSGSGCRPLDVEKPLADYTPPTEVPEPASVQQTLVIPQVPREVPAVQCLLQQLLQEPLDPWNLNLPS